MAGAPIYVPKVGMPDVGMSPIGGIQPAGRHVEPLSGDAFGAAALGRAVTAFGLAGIEIQEKIDAAAQQSIRAKATLDQITTIDELRDKYSKDPDFENAPANFARDVDERALLNAEKIRDPAVRAQATLEWQRTALSARKEVRNAALVKSHDVFRAADGTTADIDLRDAAAAVSEPERQAVVERRFGAIQSGVEAGWYSAVEGQTKQQGFLGSLAEVDARKLGAANPALAITTLQDPKRFAALSPERRQTLIEIFQGQLNGLQAAENNNLAKSNPEAAITNVGVVQPQHYERLFNHVITIESGNQPGVVSSAGALGRTQIMPDTARDVAKRLGMNDVAALDDAALKARLLDPNDRLNYQLGRAYWDQLGARYQGSVPAMLAAYNAGPGRADKWKQEAEAKFGPNYTFGQFLSVLPESFAKGETHNYLKKFAAQSGVALDAPQFARTAQLHAATSVGVVIEQQDSERRQLWSAQASGHRDDYAEMFKQGQTPDPVAYEAAKQANMRAAQAGSPDAANWLIKTLFQERAAPWRDEAYRMSSAELGAWIARVEAEHRSRPVNKDEIDRLGVIKETYKDVLQRSVSDPIGLAERARIIEPVAINPGADPTELAAALAARRPQASQAQRFYGRDYKLLKPDEAGALKTRFAAAPAIEQFAILQAAGRALDARGLDTFVDQVGARGLTMVARMAQDRPWIARDILTGRALLDEKSVQERSKAVMPILHATLGAQLYPSPDMQQEVINAAIALDVARKSLGGSLYDPDDTSGLVRAIEDVAGPIVSRNGVKVPLPPSLRKERALEILDGLSEADVALLGGASVPASAIANYGQLVPESPGSARYRVLLPSADGRGRAVFNAAEQGQVFVLDLDVLAKLPRRFRPAFDEFTGLGAP